MLGVKLNHVNKSGPRPLCTPAVRPLILRSCTVSKPWNSMLTWSYCYEFWQAYRQHETPHLHYNDVIMSTAACQITSVSIVWSTFGSGADQSKKTSKLRVTGLCAGNSPVTGEFSAQKVSNAENVSIWWRHHDPRSGRVQWHHMC